MEKWSKRGVLFVLFCSLLAGCGQKEEKQDTKDTGYEPNIVNEETTMACSKNSESDEKTDEKSENQVIQDGNLYPDTDYIGSDGNESYCYEMDSDKLKDYQKCLNEGGYELTLTELVDSIPYYYYSNGNSQVQFVDLGQTMIISVVNDYAAMKPEEDSFTTEEVLRKIQTLEKDTWERTKDETGSVQRHPAVVIQHWIPDLYEKTGMQVFIAYTKDGKREGQYLSYDGQIYATSHCFDFFENTCVADFDRDGIYELLSLCGWGSGIYRIELNVYQYGNPVCFDSTKKIVNTLFSNIFVPHNGYGQLAFKKINDQEVHLIEDESGIDYGKLLVPDQTARIVPENQDKFPYYTWEERFGAPNSQNAKDQPVMEQIPDMKVTIAGKELSVQSRKVSWHGESEEIIPFGNVMMKELEKFAYPKDHEFQDEFCFSFTNAQPDQIKVQDILMNEKGEQIYSKAGVIEREVRYGEDGNYYLGLMEHYALLLSSATYTYEQPSYRGFRVICEFGPDQICEYTFAVSVDPAWQ